MSALISAARAAEVLALVAEGKPADVLELQQACAYGAAVCRTQKAAKHLLNLCEHYSENNQLPRSLEDAVAAVREGTP